MTTISTGSGIVATTGPRELDAFEERRRHVAGHDVKDAALGVDHDVDDEVAAGHPRDGRVLLVNRIALQATVAGVGVLQEVGPVPNPHGIERRQSGTDQFASAGEAGHEMGLDQPGGDLQIGIDVAGVDPNRRAAFGLAQVRMLIALLAVMILDAIIFGDVGTDHFDEFVAEVGAVQARGHEDQNFAARDARRFERFQNRREQQRIGHGPGHVADRHARIAATVGQLTQRRRPGRQRQTSPHHRFRVGQRLRRPILEAADHVAIGQLDIQTRPAVFQVNLHDLMPRAAHLWKHQEREARTRLPTTTRILPHPFSCVNRATDLR